jgi:hypothetical protein
MNSNINLEKNNSNLEINTNKNSNSNLNLKSNINIKNSNEKPHNNINISKREEFLIDYQDLIPDIRNYAAKKEKGQIDLSFLGKEIREEIISSRVRRLFFSIVDIRNNNSPTSLESNSIIKTDNKFSNETKKMVKILLSKGISNMDIGYEMSNIYGSSTICNRIYKEKIPFLDKIKYGFCITLEISLAGLTFGLIGRRIYRFIKK